MIKKWIQFNEKLIITPGDESELKKYFDLEPEDIKEWFQDIIDEYLDLDIEISVISQYMFFVNFIPRDFTHFKNNITKDKYPISLEFQSHLQILLGEYGCRMVKESATLSKYPNYYDEFVGYSNSGKFMYIKIEKINLP